MRRNLISEFQPETRRNGVTLSVIIRNESAHQPVRSCSSRIGSAPSRPLNASRSNRPKGTRHARNTSGLTIPRRTVPPSRRPAVTSEVLAEVHAGVERRHLLPVSVERQRRALEELPYPAFPRLAPARV